MASDEGSQAAHLSALWDDLLAGQPVLGDPIAPSLRETIGCLQTLYPLQEPDPVFIEVLGRDLLRTRPTNMVLFPGNPPIGHARTGHVRQEPELRRPRAQSERPTPLRRVMAVLATAALVTVALTAGFAVMLGYRQNLPKARGVSLPAVHVIDATVAPAASIETLFSTTLPAGQVPESGVLQFFVWRLAIDPASSTPATPEGTCCQGPQLTHVLTGELAVHVSGPMHVFRGVDQVLADPVPPGTAVVLFPGDTVVHDFSVPSEYSNHGTTPAQIVNAGLYTGSSLTYFSKAVSFLDASQEFHQGPFPSGPVTMSLLQATLPPNGVFPAPPPGSLDLEVGKDGDASVGKNGDGSFVNIATADQTIYAVVVGPDGRHDLTP